ncbi:MAG: outer membrane beta-barrel protein [Magnetococcus sp. XQGC-1]
MKKSLLALSVLLMAAPSLSTAGDADLKAGDWLVRGRVVHVKPNDSTSAVSGIAGTEGGADSDTIPELDITYMLTPNVGAELILGTSSHDVVGTRGAVTGVGVANVHLLPPTLLLQYHFNGLGAVRPYVGAGLNYTFFYDVEEHSNLRAIGGTPSVSFDDGFGLAVQAGADWHINPKWFLNLDVKYIKLDTSMTISNSPVSGTTSDVTLNPLLIGGGIGYRF